MSHTPIGLPVFQRATVEVSQRILVMNERIVVENIIPSVG